jgi:ubiquinone/menaquinone biosynthesis C-methylase UbiE
MSCTANADDMSASAGDRTAAMSAYDAAAPSFERHRALPAGVPHAIRAAILAALDVSSPRLLDLGAGTGRIGGPFVAAGDDYVGVDLSLAMLREFARRDHAMPRLAQADGRHLPFADATFDAVLLIQVFGGMRGWRDVIAEARRVLRPRGAIVVGRSVAPADGIDARMKRRLSQLLADRGVAAAAGNARDDVEHALAATARSCERIVAAVWRAQRTPRRFIERHRTGARFSALPQPVRQDALDTLAAWATETFASLDAVVREQHAFELQIFNFAEMDAPHA